MVIIEQSHCYVQHIKIIANILYIKLVPFAKENTEEAYKGKGQLMIKFLL